MMQGRTVTQAQKDWHHMLVSGVGCIACRVEAGEFNDFCSIHHIDGRTKPHAHWNVLPLCAAHHQTGGEGVAFHHNKARFEKRFGTQRELLERCMQLLAEAGHDIPAGFLAWFDGEGIEA
ncbi:Ref family recombination enhancement nuclease [Pseudomonas sp. JS3066]|uniref:Ref family recombination enhancement nuclease n=1 Tax=Pseudomonas sp. JS3066 TaxID=3090665 RepID=UPI002E7C38AF|nr:Ref family recombination enhancement nuclease [Pseudomonas sp. JS3066]WVK91157.1 Ref family recombination enhancement nuclease [Pseudomonas sp. JS3066]